MIFEQMTWDRYLRGVEHTQPLQMIRPSGNYVYLCPVCDRALAIYDPKEKCWLYKREWCRQCGYEWEV